MKPHYNSLHEFFKNHDSELVHFALSNYGGSDLAINLAKSCEINNIPLVFFGLDEKSLNRLNKFAITVNNIQDNKFRLQISKNISSDFASWGSEEFKKLAWIRYELCKAILSSNKIPIYLDIDIVVKNNYEKNILKLFKKDKNLDGVFQSDMHGGICSGFFALNKNSKNKILKIFSEEFLSSNNYQNFSQPADQGFINKVILKEGNKLLNIKILPNNTYPVGMWWFDNYASIKNKVKIVHYNYLLGKDSKIKTMKEYGDYYQFSYIRRIIGYLRRIKKSLLSNLWIK